jgi:hypothetical protein
VNIFRNICSFFFNFGDFGGAEKGRGWCDARFILRFRISSLLLLVATEETYEYKLKENISSLDKVLIAGTKTVNKDFIQFLFSGRL